MRLADDERGRVPFALIGVLLLVSAVAIATVQFDQDRIDRDAALAGDRAAATAETTLRATVRDAGERAAANPVVTPAETPYGEVLDPERPYRSYLELLVAVELRERLDGTSQRVGDATGTVELPPIEDPESAATALEAVTVEANGRGVVRATVRDVPIVLRSDGERVGERTRTISANVTTPALTLHERTSTFQSRLNADSLAPGTLNRGLTGGLWSLAWPRGYGQYAGVPFDNVIDNGHAELVTNLAVLDVQRSVFGTADAEGEGRLADETARAASNEGIGMASDAFEDAALPVNASVPVSAPEVDSPEPEEREVGVDDTADHALADLIRADATPDGEIVTPADREDEVVISGGETVGVDSGVEEGPEIWEFSDTAILRTAASIDAELRWATEGTLPTRTDRDPDPGPDWSRGETINRTEPTVTVSDGSAPSPTVGDGWNRYREAERTVALEWTETVRYHDESDGGTRQVVETYRQRVAVGIALVDRPVQREWIPEGGAPDADGPIYGSLREDAAESLLADQGGVDGVSEAVARGEILETATVEVPDDVGLAETRAYRDLAGLREELRGVSENVSTGHALTNSERPIGAIRATIQRRSPQYRDVPARYDDLGHRGRVALRTMYVDRVMTRLGERVRGYEGTRADVSDEVSELTELSGSGLADFVEIGMNYTRPEPATLSAREPAPDLALTVDGDPSYLDTDAVAETAVPPPGGGEEYHPMGARTTTVASLPTDEVTSRITDAVVSVFGDEEVERVPLSVAARTLRSARDAQDGDVETELSEGDIEKLETDVEDEVDEFVPPLAEPLAAETELSESEAEQVVDETVESYPDPVTGPVIATEDGSLTALIADRAAERDDVSRLAADRARTRMRTARDEYLAETDSQVRRNRVERVGEPTRDALETAVGDAVDDANERGVEEIQDHVLDRAGFEVLPSRGFPLAPTPPWWYVTANVWHVEVHGTYASFTARADQGGPSGGGQVSYVRDGQSVALDVDGDGTPERLGSSDRIRFYATTTVAVAVPRGGGGVGNEEGGFSATTDGWDPARGAENACREPSGLRQRPTFEVCDGGTLEADREDG